MLTGLGEKLTDEEVDTLLRNCTVSNGFVNYESEYMLCMCKSFASRYHYIYISIYDLTLFILAPHFNMRIPLFLSPLPLSGFQALSKW